jgi:AcrR family transcriptional regulator
LSEVHDPIQEQLIAARQAQILDAATRVFDEKGFYRATVKDRARTVGITDADLQLFREQD